jgi:hypothetical protein
MKRTVAVVVVLTALGARVPGGPVVQPARWRQCQRAASAAGPVLRRSDASELSIRQAGTAPDCGMPLEPIYADGGGPIAKATSPPPAANAVSSASTSRH